MSIYVPVDKINVIEDLFVKGDRDLNTFQLKFGQGPFHSFDRPVSIVIPYHKLAYKGIIEGRYLVAIIDMRVDPYTRAVW